MGNHCSLPISCCLRSPQVDINEVITALDIINTNIRQSHINTERQLDSITDKARVLQGLMTQTHINMMKVERISESVLHIYAGADQAANTPTYKVMHFCSQSSKDDEYIDMSSNTIQDS